MERGWKGRGDKENAVIRRNVAPASGSFAASDASCLEPICAHTARSDFWRRANAASTARRAAPVASRMSAAPSPRGLCGFLCKKRQRFLSAADLGSDWHRLLPGLLHGAPSGSEQSIAPGSRAVQSLHAGCGAPSAGSTLTFPSESLQKQSALLLFHGQALFPSLPMARLVFWGSCSSGIAVMEIRPRRNAGLLPAYSPQGTQEP